MATRYQDMVHALAVGFVADIPTVLWGPPGNGKTSVIEDMTKGYHLETIIASTCDPTDFGGMPVPVQQGAETYINRAPMGWVKRLNDAAQQGIGGAAFLDEIGNAAPSTQAALLRPLIDGVVGDVSLAPGTRFVAAANPVSLAADGWDLKPAAANRFLHIDWVLDAATVAQGLTVGFPKVPLPKIDEDFMDRAAEEVEKAMSLVAAYLTSRPEVLNSPTDGTADLTRGFCSPRSWENAGILLGHARAMHVSDETIGILMRGIIGPGTANAFIEYIDALDLPDPEELLANPDAYVVPTTRQDRVYATLSSVVSALARNATRERFDATGTILCKVADANMADIAYVFARQWDAVRRDHREEGWTHREESIKSLGPILVEMGRMSANTL